MLPRRQLCSRCFNPTGLCPLLLSISQWQRNQTESKLNVSSLCGVPRTACTGCNVPAGPFIRLSAPRVFRSLNPPLRFPSSRRGSRLRVTRLSHPEWAPRFEPRQAARSRWAVVIFQSPKGFYRIRKMRRCWKREIRESGLAGMCGRGRGRGSVFTGRWKNIRSKIFLYYFFINIQRETSN